MKEESIVVVRVEVVSFSIEVLLSIKDDYNFCFFYFIMFFFLLVSFVV